MTLLPVTCDPMSRPWFPFYVGDYIKDTARLTTEAHGAYLLLMLDYWTKGTPPDNDEVLATITRLPVKTWTTKIRPLLRGFFTVQDGMWHHGRIEEELARAAEVTQSTTAKARNAANSRWAKNRQAKSQACSGDAPSISQAMLQNAQSQSHSLPSGESPARAPEIPKAIEGKPTPIQPDWQPSDADVGVAHELGMTDDVIDAEAAQFRRYYLARGTKFPDWHSAWASWCQRWKKPATAAPAPTGPVEIDFDKLAGFFARTGRWSRDAGPEPGMGGCRCPEEILIKYGIDPATGFVRKVSA